MPFIFTFPPPLRLRFLEALSGWRAARMTKFTRTSDGALQPPHKPSVSDVLPRAFCSRTIVRMEATQQPEPLIYREEVRAIS